MEFGDAYQCPDMLAILLYGYPQSPHLTSQSFDFPGVFLLPFGEPFLRFGELLKPLAIFAVVIQVAFGECVQIAGDSFQAFVDGHRILMFPSIKAVFQAPSHPWMGARRLATSCGIASASPMRRCLEFERSGKACWLPDPIRGPTRS